MRAATIVGKTVAAVEQQLTVTNYNRRVYDVRVIVFTDGTRLVLSACPLENDLAVEANAYKNGKELK